MSLGLPDGFSYNGSQRSNRSNLLAVNSVLYSCPNTLLGNHCSGYHNPTEHPRIFHEHTDSGLGGEQDCNFITER